MLLKAKRDATLQKQLQVCKLHHTISKEFASKYFSDFFHSLLSISCPTTELREPNHPPNTKTTVVSQTSTTWPCWVIREKTDATDVLQKAFSSLFPNYYLNNLSLQSAVLFGSWFTLKATFPLIYLVYICNTLYS